MEESENNTLFCTNCNNPVKEDDDFCPECGSLFIDGVYCENHSENLAEGVCVICSTPYCRKCGAMSNNHFLCNSHDAYEIYEGMARVYGTLDEITAQYAKSCLENEGFHPVLFSREQLYGGQRFVFKHFTSSESLGSIVSEIKIMVPFQEVLEAEKVLCRII